ncbi:MAG: GIY-YIG nuclease family protein [Pseudomonadota bacterium]|nr:GIY-YIG nuclease family protein [Pseudomonadota bacterium]MEC8104625.1 GIY-YIG nuclease family protein [Pseudomonadota bacterium]
MTEENNTVAVEPQTCWYLYLIETASGQLYCGITLDVARRFHEHAANKSKTARSLRGKGPLTLRYAAKVGTHGDALRAELRVKKLTRTQKLRLVDGDTALALELGLSRVVISLS